MVYGVRALFNGMDNGKDIIHQMFQKYNQLYEGELQFPTCNTTIGDWSPVGSLAPDGQDVPGIYKFIEPQFPNLSSKNTEWIGMLEPKDQIRNDNCMELCKEAAGGGIAANAICSQLCDNINICDAEINDERDLLEIPATDLTFTCPARQFLKAEKAAGRGIYFYEFRNIMPADVRHIGGLNSGKSTYERCFTEVSCHAADLSYIFEMERRVNCNDERKSSSTGSLYNTLLGLSSFVWDPYCDKDTGSVVDENGQLMERSMRRYWANFARNGES